MLSLFYVLARDWLTPSISGPMKSPFQLLNHFLPIFCSFSFVFARTPAPGPGGSLCFSCLHFFIKNFVYFCIVYSYVVLPEPRCRSPPPCLQFQLISLVFVCIIEMGCVWLDRFFETIYLNKFYWSRYKPFSKEMKCRFIPLCRWSYVVLFPSKNMWLCWGMTIAMQVTRFGRKRDIHENLRADEAYKAWIILPVLVSQCVSMAVKQTVTEI